MQNIINNMTGYLLLSCTECLLSRVQIKFCTFNDTCMSTILSGLNSYKNVMLSLSLSLSLATIFLTVRLNEITNDLGLHEKQFVHFKKRNKNNK